MEFPTTLSPIQQITQVLHSYSNKILSIFDSAHYFKKHLQNDDADDTNNDNNDDNNIQCEKLLSS